MPPRNIRACPTLNESVSRQSCALRHSQKIAQLFYFFVASLLLASKFSHPHICLHQWIFFQSPIVVAPKWAARNDAPGMVPHAVSPPGRPCFIISSTVFCACFKSLLSYLIRPLVGFKDGKQCHTNISSIYSFLSRDPISPPSASVQTVLILKPSASVRPFRGAWPDVPPIVNASCHSSPECENTRKTFTVSLTVGLLLGFVHSLFSHSIIFSVLWETLMHRLSHSWYSINIYLHQYFSCCSYNSLRLSMLNSINPERFREGLCVRSK